MPGRLPTRPVFSRPRPRAFSRCTSGRALLRINGIAAAIRSGRRKGRAHSGISGHGAGGKQRLHPSPCLWLLYHKQGEAAPQKGRMKGPQTPGAGRAVSFLSPPARPHWAPKKAGLPPRLTAGAGPPFAARAGGGKLTFYSLAQIKGIDPKRGAFRAFSTALRPPGSGRPPSAGSALRGRPVRGPPRSASPRRKCPSSFSAAG